MIRPRVVALGAGMAWSLALSVAPVAGRQAAPLEDDVRARVAAILDVNVADIRVDLAEATPDADQAPERAADSVSVRRGSGDGWILTSWIGETARARLFEVGVVETVAVAARDLPRGHALTPEDVAWSERVRPLSEAVGTPDPVGQVVERAMRAGELLAAPAVRPPLLVRGGEAVEAVFDEGAVRMSLRATALASAREGGHLHVRLETGRRLEATAVDRGRVRLSLGGGS